MMTRERQNYNRDFKQKAATIAGGGTQLWDIKQSKNLKK